MTTDQDRRLGTYVKSLRKKRLRPDGERWTQEDLAHEAGVSSSTIARLEQGRTTQPRRGELSKVATALGTTVEALFAEAYAGEPPPAELAPSDLDPRIAHAFRGSLRPISDFMIQAADLPERDRVFFISAVEWAFDKIESARQWENARRAVHEADLAVREPQPAIAGNHATK